jgi:carboxyl-terminal processing protease
VEAGYGVQWVLIAARPPRQLKVAYVEPGSAAAGKIDRGADVQKIDGEPLLDGDPAKLNAGLFPASIGETHTFEFKDVAGATHSVPLTSVNVTHQPVQNVGTVASGVGYMLFNDHLATAEKALIDAVTTLQAKGITDLVLDIRYNGGGYLAIASQLAYMIAGPGPTASKFFEQTQFNDKYRTTDPYSGKPLAPTPFYKTSVGLSVNQGQPLPHLDLPRVFVLTGHSTCSASESVINGLRGVDVQVIEIGGTTCGKPYGFVPQDNCGTTYFTIQFQGVNAKGFGDYPDGFEPAGTTTAGVPGCKVADDFNHALGDPNEARLAAALQYRTSQTCPPVSASIASALTVPGGEGEALRNIWRENRWQ